jgi:hypothetical protein
VAIALAGFNFGRRVTISFLGVFFPVLVVCRVLDFFLEICYRSTIRTQKVGPRWSIEDRPDASVVPDMGAWRDEERLARLWMLSASMRQYVACNLPRLTSNKSHILTCVLMLHRPPVCSWRGSGAFGVFVCCID